VSACVVCAFTATGVYVWGKDWVQAKTQAESYEYLFQVSEFYEYLSQVSESYEFLLQVSESYEFLLQVSDWASGPCALVHVKPCTAWVACMGLWALHPASREALAPLLRDSVLPGMCYGHGSSHGLRWDGLAWACMGLHGIGLDGVCRPLEPDAASLCPLLYNVAASMACCTRCLSTRPAAPNHLAHLLHVSTSRPWNSGGGRGAELEAMEQHLEPFQGMGKVSLHAQASPGACACLSRPLDSPAHRPLQARTANADTTGGVGQGRASELAPNTTGASPVGAQCTQAAVEMRKLGIDARRAPGPRALPAANGGAANGSAPDAVSQACGLGRQQLRYELRS